MLEGRREQFGAEVAGVEGVAGSSALAQVDAAIDRWVWYAGWADKISQVRGTVNPVAGPYWNVSSPEPTGVVAVFAPRAAVAVRPGLGARAGDRVGQHGGGGRPRLQRPAGDHAGRGAGHLGPCPAAWSTS